MGAKVYEIIRAQKFFSDNLDKISFQRQSFTQYNPNDTREEHGTV